ncbi:MULTISPECIES: hypothetical protein [Streptomyces]|uniref:hypothetical protein n=1 Tax=Streptomyces TaxID=1883 RepID=UPI0006B02C65|nr:MULTISPECIES: hypothetical protein [unclassified Streptomyces]KOU20775.1 hypothetical protein ADK49_09430 [Streptomyces sp. WM6349]KOV47230.1 hypothetical protein ADK98_10735 [Streptomyces sp. H036]
MASLAWLLIPLFAAIGAAIWGSWAARDRTQGDISELAGYARFREAMGNGQGHANADQMKAKAEAASASDAV